MKRLLTITILATTALFTVSCGDDDEGTSSASVSISKIPASATILEGDNLTVTGVSLVADAGFASENAFTVSVDGGQATDLSSLITGASPQTVDVTLSTTGLALGEYDVVFTLTDANGLTDDVDHTLTISNEVMVSANITTNTTWVSTRTYVLTTRVAVQSGATLTIEPGTLIKGAAGTGANATALIIARGATLNAKGTATKPIIFTSQSDNLTTANVAAGTFASPNLANDVDGLWGGLIVLGNAPIFVSGDNETANIEGIPANDANGLYGGSTANDNSGTITYVSVRYGGANIGEGNEINGITFGGVGSVTTVNHIEVVSNQDDGVEFFGGSVNVSDVLVWNNGDDAIDTDQGYSGRISNGIIINPGDKAFELDGGEGSDDTQTLIHTISNFTIYLEGAGGTIDVDDDTNVTMTNCFFTDIDEDTGTSYDMIDGKSGITNTFTNIEIINTWDDDGTPTSTVADRYLSGSKSSIVSTPSTGVGADESEFNGWSLAAIRRAF